MVTGQMKVPKYCPGCGAAVLRWDGWGVGALGVAAARRHPYFERCFNITKTLTQEQHVLTDTAQSGVCGTWLLVPPAVLGSCRRRKTMPFHVKWLCTVSGGGCQKILIPPGETVMYDTLSLESSPLLWN